MSASSFSAILTDDLSARNNSVPSGCTVLDIQPDSMGCLVDTKVAVSNTPAGLGDLVPLARTLAAKISSDAMDHAENAGEKVPCRKGCGACCSYLVPLSAPEALCMGREIGSLSSNAAPEIARSLTDAAGRILAGWPDSPFAKSESDGDEECDIEAVGRWYAGLNLTCPFLSHGACTIYDSRPLACREHAVLGSESHCSRFNPKRKNSLEMPVKVLDALGQLAADLEQTEVQAVMMPLVPFWYEENRHRALQTWDGPELVSRFLDCLAATADQTNASQAA